MDKIAIVKDAREAFYRNTNPAMTQIEQFQKILTSKENAEILSKRRDTRLMEAAKIVGTFGTVLIYRWLMGDQVTRGIKNANFFSTKYRELLRSETQDTPHQANDSTTNNDPPKI